MKKVVRRGLHTYGYLLIIATITALFGALTTIGVSAEVTFDTNYYEYDINHDGVISEDEKGVTITGFNWLNGGETVVIPAEIDGRPVFALGLNGVTGGHIPNADKIGALDFTQATNLKVILPYAFYWCPNIEGAVQCNTVEKVGDHAFSGTGLTSITLKEGCDIDFYTSCEYVPDNCEITYVNDKGDVVKTVKLSEM